jgi:putative endonuclease
MFYVYVLRSDRDGKLYKGHTKNLNGRIQRHNSGLVLSTKHRVPLRLVYYEVVGNKSEAVMRELFFKSCEGGAYIKNKLK